MKIKKLFFFLILNLLITPLFAGGIKGSIKNDKGESLSFATIYIKNNHTGTTSNVEGNYSIQLEAGTYDVVFQYLGYQSLQKEVTISGTAFKEVNVTLKLAVLDLELVEVLANEENPAYTVMRKAIAKSKFHLQQLDSYTARVYTKGTGRIKKVPFFLRKTMKKEGFDPSRAFTSESVSDISYTRPNTYSEKVISVYTSGDDNSASPNEYINGSFYEPELNGSVSPLSPKSFAYYRFSMMGTFFDQGKMINKIKVTPRSKGDKVFSGFINIVEDDWSIHSLDMTTFMLGFTYNIQQIYKKIEDKAWLPISHTFLIRGKLLGFDFEYNYLATVSNYQLVLNPDLEIELVVIDETIHKEKAKELKSISKNEKKKNKKKDVDQIQTQLASGEEIRRKDLRKMMRQYEKEERKESTEPKVERDHTLSVDSMATKRGADYWATIRPVPLTEFEVRGYHFEDSIATVKKNKAEKDSIKEVKKVDSFLGIFYLQILSNWVKKLI